MLCAGSFLLQFPYKFFTVHLRLVLTVLTKGVSMKQRLKYVGLSIALCSALAGHAKANEFNHYVAYLEAINAKHDEVQDALAGSAGDGGELSRYQEVIWTHIYHLLGLVKETVEFENTNVWVWTDEHKYGYIKYIGALPQEANRTFATEESLRGRYDAQTKKISLAAGNGLTRVYDMPGVTRVASPASLRYTRLVTYLTEEVERLLAAERAIATVLQNGVQEKPQTKPKPKPKAKPKPAPAPVALPASPRPLSVKPVAIKPKELPLPVVVEVLEPELDLPAYENDDIEAGLFATLTFPEISFGGAVDPVLVKNTLLITGAIAGSLSVLHFTDQYYFDGVGSARILNMLSAVRRQLGRPFEALRLERLREALRRVTTYLGNTRLARGMSATASQTKAFTLRVAGGVRGRALDVVGWFTPVIVIDEI